MTTDRFQKLNDKIARTRAELHRLYGKRVDDALAMIARGSTLNDIQAATGAKRHTITLWLREARRAEAARQIPIEPGESYDRKCARWDLEKEIGYAWKHGNFSKFKPKIDRPRRSLTQGIDT